MIKNVTINWMEKYGNDPQIHVDLDGPFPEYPAQDAPIWKRFDPGFHVAETGDIVRYFYTDGKPTVGFGGAEFVGTFLNGDRFRYIGAWSSRAGCINNLDLGFMIVDVACERMACAVRLTALLDWLDENPDSEFRFALTHDGREYTVRPTRNGKLKNDSGVKIIQQY